MTEEQRGFNEGMEAGKTEGLALAQVFTELSKEAAALYRQKLEERMAKLVVDGNINAKTAFDVSEIFMEIAFNCGATAMFMNRTENVQQFEALKSVVTQFANKDKKS